MAELNGQLIENGLEEFKKLTSSGARWDIRLTDEEIAQLKAGVLPTLIQPDHLVEYWPLTQQVEV